MPLTGGWDISTISGTTMTGITQHYGPFDTYYLGSYSSTLNGITYYTNGDTQWCSNARIAQITWSCGQNHIHVVAADEPEPCEYHFQVEINCCIAKENPETWNGM